MRQPTIEARALLAGVRVLPVVTLRRVERATPLAAALRAGGLAAIEITLRTPVALAAIAEIKAIMGADLLVGAGTVKHAHDAAAAKAAGADFLVAPGATPGLAAALLASGLPALPGAATASEAMALAEHGFDTLKFFPAEAAGGIEALAALAGPLPEIMFCPTGGISEARAPDYLAQANVICVGGSWVANEAAIEAEDWRAIESAAARAARL